MTKEQLIAELADRANVTKAAAELMLDGLVDIVLDRAKAGEETRIHRFGTFDSLDKKARTGRNPQTGQPIQLPAVKVLRFRPSKTTRNDLN